MLSAARATLLSVASRQGRSSAVAVARLSTSAHRQQSLVTKEERWTQETATKASQLISSGSGFDVKQVLPNIEARWKDMPTEEQYAVFRQLEEIQKKDWKELSIDEKKAAYFISFGPHGPRRPIVNPGQSIRTFTAVSACILAAFGVFYGLRQFANPNKPKTMTVEYQEAMTERAKEEKQNPITGITSEGYKGKGHVQSSLA
ncbi:COX4-domain-containing protein [Tilletiaria anomala UBC 951]|uniref:COX4-domain-containing protein n=1 Tax=Tilletiaria anomala (strain ATCC 24038 / CBS 436.72 / UBC 951) TaxID=1037660 RepID=A0A066VNV2_TILAU|nr:COX4-domain-containing protein [Tilletiaria anomala UBC 951]KDN40260.1 COX4-domain-containing protein [Tilletiaria anomala UBC 951]